MPKIYRKGKSYGGYYTGPAQDTSFDNSEITMKSENVQDAIVEMWREVTKLKGKSESTLYHYESVDGFKQFLIQMAEENEGQKAFSIRYASELFGEDGNYMGFLYTDNMGNYTFIIHNHWNNKSFIGSFNTYDEDLLSTFRMYEMNTSDTNLL